MRQRRYESIWTPMDRWRPPYPGSNSGRSFYPGPKPPRARAEIGDDMAPQGPRAAALPGEQRRPVVLPGPQRCWRVARRAVLAPLPFARRPFAQASVGDAAVPGHLLGVGQLDRQFQADAVGVEEVDALEDMVVGHAEHLDAMRLQALARVLQLLQ